MKTNSAKTHFIAFYSYKGGVGRTLALANCTRALAATGKRVVVMDFDLEAPGLEHFEALRPRSEKKPKIDGDYPPLAGFAEYIGECRAKAPPEKLAAYLHLCKGMEGDKGEVWLMPAGRRNDPSYQSILGLDWDRFYREEDGFRLMENLRGHIEDEIGPDYVLMDARTGLTEMGGIATHQLADMVVLLFNLNRQNLEGTKRVHDSLIGLETPPILILAASPIPAMPTGKGTPFYEKMQIIRRTLKGARNFERPIVIPYQPILAWEERILVDQKDDPFDFDGAYRRLLELILDTLNDPKYFLRLATEHWQNNDIRGAIEILEKGLKENPGNPDLSVWLANLSRDGNSLAVAQQVQQSRIAEMSEKLGDEHPATLLSINNLAAMLYAQGDLPGARVLQEQVLKLLRRIQGEEHPDTLSSMNNLAATLSAQGDLPSAHTLQEQVVEISRRIQGAEHPNTLTSMNNLAETLRAQGDLPGARSLQELALEISRRIQGAEHPDTLLNMNNLAVTLSEQGDLPGARILLEQVLEISRRILGAEHPNTLSNMNNLANTLRAQGDLPSARILQGKVLDIQGRVLGAQHPETSIYAFNLFDMLLTMKETEAAMAVFRDYLDWLLQRDPDSLGADQNNIRGQLIEHFRQNPEEIPPPPGADPETTP